MRELDPPDWGYFGSAWGIVAVGLGFLLVNVYQEVGSVLVVLGLIFLLYSLRPTWRSLLAEPKQARSLEVAAFLHDLPYLSNVADELVTAGRQGRTFALLRITNNGSKDLAGLVAECSVSGVPSEEIRCFWSRESGRAFVEGGEHRADLSVGDSRLLVIAQAVTDGARWLRLPKTNLYQAPSRGIQIGAVPIHRSQAGEILDIANSGEIVVRFRAEGVDQVERVRLGFKRRQPTVNLLT